MTPKAPPDIDKWVIDPLASNSSLSALKKRDNGLSLPDVHDLPPFATPLVDNLSVSYILLAPFADPRLYVIIVVLWGVIMCWHWLSLSLRVLMNSDIDGRIGKQLALSSRLIRLLLPMLAVLYICQQVLSEQKSWSATLAFLEACRDQQVCLPLEL